MGQGRTSHPGTSNDIYQSFSGPQRRSGNRLCIYSRQHEFVKLAETTAWNWQQEAQLQWVQDRNTGQESVLFNDRRDGGLAATILDPDSCEQRTVDFPIYTVSPSGQDALSLNYARLFDVRKDYGIAGFADPYKDVLRPEQDGIFSIDLSTGKRKLVCLCNPNS